MGIPRRYMIGVGTVGVITVVFLVLALRPVVMAISARNDLAKVTRDHLSEEQMRKWASGHHGGVTCDGGRCTGSVYISNRLLHALGLAPLTRFDAEIITDRGQAVQASLSLSDVQYLGAASGATTVGIIAYEAKEGSYPIHAPFVLKGLHGPTGKPPLRIYMVTPHSAPQAIARAFEINVWCLARIGGCSPSQQAPPIWALPPTPIPEGANLNLDQVEKVLGTLPDNPESR